MRRAGEGGEEKLQDESEVVVGMIIKDYIQGEIV